MANKLVNFSDDLTLSLLRFQTGGGGKGGGGGILQSGRQFSESFICNISEVMDKT